MPKGTGASLASEYKFTEIEQCLLASDLQNVSLEVPEWNSWQDYFNRFAHTFIQYKIQARV